MLPDDVKVTILAGFADTKLFGFLAELGFDYVIRLKGNTKVSAADPSSQQVGLTAACLRLAATTLQSEQGLIQLSYGSLAGHRSPDWKVASSPGLRSILSTSPACCSSA